MNFCSILCRLVSSYFSLLNPNLGRREGKGGNFIPPSWISLNNSKTVKAVTLEFCSIQLHSVRDIHVKFSIHNLPQSADIGQNSDGCISDFKGNKTTSKKCDIDVMSGNCYAIVIFWIFGQFGAVQRPDSRHRVCKNNVFSNSNFLSYKS